MSTGLPADVRPPSDSRPSASTQSLTFDRRLAACGLACDAPSGWRLRAEPDRFGHALLAATYASQPGQVAMTLVEEGHPIFRESSPRDGIGFLSAGRRFTITIALGHLEDYGSALRAYRELLDAVRVKPRCAARHTSLLRRLPAG